jgi:hypothetical protein
VDVGLRRVSWVRVDVDADGAVRCQLAGIGHRRPVVRRLPLRTAAALAAAGVPLVVRHEGRAPSHEGDPDGLRSMAAW